MNPVSDMIHPADARRLLDCPASSFNRFLRQGRIPGAVRIGPRITRIHRATFEAWMRGGAATPHCGDGA